MATRWYLRETNDAGTYTEQSPDAANKGSFTGLYHARQAKGASSTPTTILLTNSTTSAEFWFYRAFHSPPLEAQTVASGTWTTALVAIVSNTNLSHRLRVYAYVLRGGANVATIFGPTNAPNLTTTTAAGRIVTASGVAGFTLQSGDVIVVEVWSTGSSSMTNGYTHVVHHGANDENITEGGANASAASYVEFSGTITEISTDVALAGSTSGAATMTGAAVIDRGVAGSVAGASSLSGALALEVGLTGASTGSGSASGTLTVETSDTLLDGAAAGVGSAAAALSVDRTVAGDVQGTATSTGAMLVERGLAAQASGSSTAAGALAIDRALAGACAGSSAAAGALTIEGTVDLAAAAAGGSSTSGALSVDAALAGVAVGTSSASGALEIAAGEDVQLAGAAPGGAAAAGVLTLDLDLQGATPGTSTASGALFEVMPEGRLYVEVRPTATRALVFGTTTTAAVASSRTSAAASSPATRAGVADISTAVAIINGGTS